MKVKLKGGPLLEIKQYVKVKDEGSPIFRTGLYVKVKSKGIPLTNIAKVLVVAFEN